jgi:hypothetical protein
MFTLEPPNELATLTLGPLTVPIGAGVVRGIDPGQDRRQELWFLKTCSERIHWWFRTSGDSLRCMGMPTNESFRDNECRAPR